jgi:hypothetical protein
MPSGDRSLSSTRSTLRVGLVTEPGFEYLLCLLDLRKPLRGGLYVFPIEAIRMYLLHTLTKYAAHPKIRNAVERRNAQHFRRAQCVVSSNLFLRRWSKHHFALA